MIASSECGLSGILEAEDLRGPQDLAAVERRDLQPLQPLVRDLLQLVVPVALGDQPEEVLDLDVAVVPRRADGLEIGVDALAELVVVLQLPVRLPEVERADVADRHQRLGAGLLAVGQDPSVQVEVVVGLGLVDVACAAARDCLELVELDVEHRRERLRGRVQLLRRERGEAALVVGDLHPAAAISPDALRPSRCAPRPRRARSARAPARPGRCRARRRGPAP